MNIVFDIGGTNMRIARADGESLGEVRKVPTPHSFEDMIGTFVTIAKELSRGESISGTAGGIPGMIVDGVFAYEPPHLAQWVGKPFISELERQLGCKARAANDVAVVGLGEALKGAGQGSKIMVYYTVSTGVNGARIVNGEIDAHIFGFEAGHQLIPDGELESLVSGTAVRKKFGIEPKELDSIDERNKLADQLAIGLYNSVLHWSPDTIVLGGSMITGVNPIPLDRTAESLKKHLTMYPSAPTIQMATLGDPAGLYGGMVLASR